MSEDNDNKKDNKQTEPQYKTLDPTGQIKAYAKQLWRENGSPAAKDWQDYLGIAEKMLIAGTGAGVHSGRTRTDKPKEKKVSEDLQQLIDQTEDVLVSILASAIKRTLREHESFCLAVILQQNILRTKDGLSIGPLDIDRSSQVIAQLAEEYDSEFLRNEGSDPLKKIPLAQRSSYWKDKILLAEARDEALNFTDLNTIQRLELRIKAEDRVESLKHVGKAHIVGAHSVEDGEAND